MARERTKNPESQAVEPRRGSRLSRFEPWPSWVSPFGLMRRLTDEMDRMFEGSGFPAFDRHWTFSEGFSPKVDMFERDGKLVISADLPGLTKDDLRVEVTDDAVVIEGERKTEHEERESGVYRCERSYGRFHRTIPLPEGVKADSVTAAFTNGVLEITTEAPHLSRNRRQIQIQGEGRSTQSGQSAA